MRVVPIKLSLRQTLGALIAEDMWATSPKQCFRIHPRGYLWHLAKADK